MKPKFKIGDEVRLKKGAKRESIPGENISYPKAFTKEILIIKEFDSIYEPGTILYRFEGFYSSAYEQHLEKVKTCRLNRGRQ